MNTPTPRTDAKYESICESWENKITDFPKMTDFARTLERELTAAREEITLLKTNLKIQTNHTENAVQDRADEHIELHNQIQELTEQRDRLAAALTKIQGVGLVAVDAFDELDIIDEIVDEALQSLNQPTEL